MSLLGSLFGKRNRHLDSFYRVIDSVIEKEKDRFDTTRAGAEILSEYAKYKVYVRDNLVKRFAKDENVDYKAVVYKDMITMLVNLYDFYKGDPFFGAQLFRSRACLLLCELKRDGKITEQQYNSIMSSL